jgi:hypothetical protein
MPARCGHAADHWHASTKTPCPGVCPASATMLMTLFELAGVPPFGEFGSSKTEHQGHDPHVAHTLYSVAMLIAHQIAK